ncbi:MAG: hypothetical protein J6W58_01700 [Lachnospiraceae bacterium]|nr:hypothetical protein [Lachnospiraceae bacterium]MBP5744999.1 hypothetical protein [Lachnospiraceae bacterium]
MIELTSGELRDINESTNGWRMMVDDAIGKMTGVSDETKKHIDALEKQFKEELSEFYMAAKGGSEQIDADDIFAEFDEKWNEEHPEFYDLKRLLV